MGTLSSELKCTFFRVPPRRQITLRKDSRLYGKKRKNPGVGKARVAVTIKYSYVHHMFSKIKTNMKRVTTDTLNK